MERFNAKGLFIFYFYSTLCSSNIFRYLMSCHVFAQNHYLMKRHSALILVSSDTSFRTCLQMDIMSQFTCKNRNI